MSGEGAPGARVPWGHPKIWWKALSGHRSQLGTGRGKDLCDCIPHWGQAWSRRDQRGQGRSVPLAADPALTSALLAAPPGHPARLCLQDLRCPAPRPAPAQLCVLLPGRQLPGTAGRAAGRPGKGIGSARCHPEPALLVRQPEPRGPG